MLELAIDRSPGDLDAVRHFLEVATRQRGRRPLSDEHWLALTTRSPDVAAAVVARDDGQIVAFGQAVRGNDAHSLELAVRDPAEYGAVGFSVVRTLLDALRADGVTGRVHYWLSAPTPEDDRVARSAGLEPARRLLQMRRPLPTGLAVDVATRPFRPGADEEMWVTVNNRAFAGHPEQGAWTVEDLARRQAEPWFSAEGFRLHERDGRLAAFCWTKLHEDEDPPLGEIYVIGVDPDFQGLGLGRQLTLAGLASIADRGIETGMLYVDEANAGALTMYEKLGFAVHHVDVAYATDLGTQA